LGVLEDKSEKNNERFQKSINASPPRNEIPNGVSAIKEEEKKINA